MTADPAAQAAYRVPRYELDALFIPGEQMPESRVGTGTVVSVDSSNTCTVLINDEDVPGVLWLGKFAPAVSTVVEVEMRGDLLVIPSSNDLDTFIEGASETVEHIVSTDDPGLPPAEDVPVGGSMRSNDAWSFWGPDQANWSRDLSESGTGMRCYQNAPPTFVARNMVTIGSGEAGIGPDDNGNSWQADDGTGGTYNSLATITTTDERGYVGTTSLLATWLADPKPSAVGLKVGGHTAGQVYTASAWVYVPTGSPDVRLINRAVVQSAVTTTKDAFVQLTITYTATAAEQVIGISTTGGVASTAGVCFIDAVMVNQLSLANLLTNPGMETVANGTATTNLLSNPSFEVDTAFWTATRGTVTRIASASSFSGGYVAQLVNDATVSSHYLGLTTRVAATAGTTYTFSYYAKLPSGGTGGANRYAQINFYDSGSTLLNSYTGTTASITTSGWTRFTVTATAPANTATAGVYLICSSGTEGETWLLDGVQLEATAAATAYYDGSLAATTSYSYAWTGTAHASTSTRTPKIPTTVAFSGNAEGVASSAWSASGSNSLELYGKPGGSNDSACYIQGNNTTDGTGNVMQPGKTYYLACTMRLTAPLTGTLSSGSRRIDVFYNTVAGGGLHVQSSQAPNAAGIYRLEMTFTVPTNAAWCCFRIYNGSSYGNGSVWIDDVMITETTASPAYFDGASTDTSTDQYVWLGTPYLAVSEHYAGALPPSIVLGTNYLTNPSFETNTTGWSPVRSTITRTASATAFSGGYVLRVTNDGTANTHYANTATAQRLPVTAGQVWTISGYARLISGDGIDYVAKCWFYDNTGTVVGSSVIGVKTVLPSTGAWVRLSLTVTVPNTSGIVTMGPAFSTQNTAQTMSNSDVWELDAVMCELSPTLNSYYDGSTLPNYSGYYAWSGTAHASSSTRRTAPPVTPPAPTGTLWSEQTFDVEPGQTLSWSMDLAEIANDTTAQLYVLYGGTSGAAPLPTDADVLAAPVGSNVALASSVSTVSGTLVIPDSVTLPVSGIVLPATARIGVRFTGTGASQVLATKASATIQKSGWPLGSQWMDPDAPDGGQTTLQSSGNFTGTQPALPYITVDAAIPNAKKAVITAPDNCGGLALVIFHIVVTLRNAPAVPLNIRLRRDSDAGTVMCQSFVTAGSTVNQGSVPLTIIGSITLLPGEEVHVYPVYAYNAGTVTDPHTVNRMSTDVLFLPGAVRSGGSNDPTIRYWDGDSWRPEINQGATFDLTKDATTGNPVKTNTSTTISRLGGTPHAGTSIPLTVTVSPTTTGSVTFYKSSSSSGPWTSLGSVALSNGKCTKNYAGAGGQEFFKATFLGNSSYNPSTSAIISITWQTLVTYTKTISCSWAQAYGLSGNKVTNTGHDNAVFQGDFNGDLRHSLLRFDRSGIPSGADVTAVSLICKSGGWDWWANGTGTLLVGRFTNQSSVPMKLPTTNINIHESDHAVGTGGWTANISSWACGAVEDPLFSGVVLGPVSSTSMEYSGYSAQPGIGQFTLSVTYKVWE